MNNLSAPVTGYCSPSYTGVEEKEIKCKFCDSLLLPFSNYHSGISCLLCVTCPNPVYYDGSTCQNYILYCQYNNHWYNFIYLPVAKQYLIYQIKNQLIINSGHGTENYSFLRELVKQIESEENITPTNVKDKLITILTFG